MTLKRGFKGSLVFMQHFKFIGEFVFLCHEQVRNHELPKDEFQFSEMQYEWF